MQTLKKALKYITVIFSAVTTLFCMRAAVKEKDSISAGLKQ